MNSGKVAQLSSSFRVEICGGIASGKTTFAGLFAEDADVCFEDFKAVPFWRAFLDSPGLHNFEAELSFLLQHYHQVKGRFLEPKAGLIVCDFAFLLDRAYSVISLHGGKRNAFETVLREVLADVRPPDLIVHLVCSPEEEMHRIRARGRAGESSLDMAFLQSLNQALESEVRSFRTSRPIMVDSEMENFAADTKVRTRCRALVLSKIQKMIKDARVEEQPQEQP